MNLQTDSSGVQLNIARGKDPYYPAWPPVTRLADGSVGCALQGLDRVRQALGTNDRKALWADSEDVAWYSGLSYTVVHLRLLARLRGVREAWPWSEVRRGPQAFLPQLVKEWLWVPRRTGRELLGQAQSSLMEAISAGWIRTSYCVFRGYSKYEGKRRTCLYLPDVLRRKQLVMLRELFGRRFGAAKLEVLRNIPVETLLRIKAGKLLPSEWSEEWESQATRSTNRSG